ncbi:FAD-binding oxidoreductase [uncultured Roseobacter sp.]|uniref:NAD(P)/FAD-dependent oxidoreductase n=1 Tax=uncultured Roseobacter sp. TaxID=114847 RepID=UPI00260BE160|nr:FAD-binding oxidoreductase [uncultured Roseobacter sp.]
MNRIFPEYTYGAGPRETCWWDQTCTFPDRGALLGEYRADVAIIGAGFTGLSAALHLARNGLRVAVLEANFPGWGASGRNGGFCCLGGGKIDDAALDKKFGQSERLAYRSAEKAAVALVSDLIDEFNWNVDRHSNGETVLAHKPKHMDSLKIDAATVEENYGVSPKVIEKEALGEAGLAGPFFGAVTNPIGFALNPAKYLTGLSNAAERFGALIFHNSPVHTLSKAASQWRLASVNGDVLAEQVIVATNGYSSENLPDWLAGRYMPGQSTVLVTRPLTIDEISAQGWHSEQMSYDTRNLLHYFRLMPDRRFLFGMRGGLLSGSHAEARARRKVRRDFEKMFPAWAGVASHHSWSGMVSLARNRLPFVGELPDQPGIWAGMCYHGNGVAMSTFSGKLLAELILGKTPENYPLAMRRHLTRFPFGRYRRVIMPPVYAGLMVSDL